MPVADQHRDVGHANLELVEYRLHAGIVLHIDVGVRIAVPRKERPETQRIAGMAGSDQYRLAHGMRDQIHTPQEERPQECLPEFGIGLDDPPQIWPVDLEQRAGFMRAASHQTPAA